MSVTVGRKGFHLNFSKHGVRQTTGLPGSGISHTSYLFKNNDEDEEQDPKESEERSEERTEKKQKRQRAGRATQEQASSPWGFFLFLVVALFFIYFGARAFGLIPPDLVTDLLSTLTQWARQVGL